ncbi:MAG: DUF3857 domain-containing protein [Bacteroides sp.]|nr:DUF3857 domain-containing protein [Bacteroides sp.]
MMAKRLFGAGLMLLLSGLGCLQAQVNRYPNAYSVVEEAATDIVCTSPTEAVRKERLSITVFSEKGKDDANFYCPCNDFCTLRKFAGTISDANGNVIRKIKKNELQSSEYSTEMASDDYFYYFNYSPSRYPFTVTYEWEMEYDDGLIGFPSFIPHSGYNQAVAKASYSLQLPPGMAYRYEAVNMQPDVKEETIADGGKRIHVQIADMPALTNEPFSPPIYDLLPRVFFVPETFSYENTTGKLDSWQNFGLWQYSLLEGRDLLPPELIQLLKEKTAHCRSEREKVAAVYDYLASTTRYVSIQLGIGGLQPAPAAEVYRTGFGDCKGLSNYTRAMLSALGIRSYYTVISTNNARFLPRFASANQANHVILQVPLPQDTLWLECTNPKLPLGYVHHSIAGHDALLVTPEGGRLCRLPTYPDTLNTQVNRALITLNADASAHIEVEQRSRLFQYEDRLGLIRLAPNKQKDRLRSTLTLTQADIRSVRYDEHKQDIPELCIDYTADTDQYGTLTGKRLFLPCNIFHRGFNVPDETDHRQLDVDISYGYTDTDSISILLPDNYTVESLPQTIHLQTPFGEFQSIVRAEAGSIHIFHRLHIPQGRYAKEDYSQFLAFRKAVATQYGSRIIIKKKEL